MGQKFLGFIFISVKKCIHDFFFRLSDSIKRKLSKIIQISWKTLQVSHTRIIHSHGYYHSLLIHNIYRKNFPPKCKENDFLQTPSTDKKRQEELCRQAVTWQNDCRTQKHREMNFTFYDISSILWTLKGFQITQLSFRKLGEMCKMWSWNTLKKIICRYLRMWPLWLW